MQIVVEVITQSCAISALCHKGIRSWPFCSSVVFLISKCQTNALSPSHAHTNQWNSLWWLNCPALRFLHLLHSIVKIHISYTRCCHKSCSIIVSCIPVIEMACISLEMSSFVAAVALYNVDYVRTSLIITMFKLRQSSLQQMEKVSMTKVHFQ